MLGKYQIKKKQKCLTEDQARQIYKKVEMDKIINIETMKQKIEDDKYIPDTILICPPEKQILLLKI